VSQPPQPSRRTNVYIDSRNLYYGCLKNTPYRWLDVAEMAQRSLPAHYVIGRIHFFTAKVSARPGGDPQQPQRQEAFFRALETLPNLTMHYGTFLTTDVMMPLVTPLLDGTRFARVIKTEEKGSDVNIVATLISEGYKGDYGAAAVVSDDSDLAEALRIVRYDLRLHVRVLSPRGRAHELRQAANRFHKIDPAVLKASQFPPTLQDAHGTFHKPANW